MAVQWDVWKVEKLGGNVDLWLVAMTVAGTVDAMAAMSADELAATSAFEMARNSMNIRHYTIQNEIGIEVPVLGLALTDSLSFGVHLLELMMVFS